MKILLLDSDEFEKTEGRVFFHISYHSLNMKKYVKRIWSNGWCPISQFKIDAAGHLYGRIANELIPSGYYNNIAVETNENVLINKWRNEL